MRPCALLREVREHLGVAGLTETAPLVSTRPPAPRCLRFAGCWPLWSSCLRPLEERKKDGGCPAGRRTRRALGPPSTVATDLGVQWGGCDRSSAHGDHESFLLLRGDKQRSLRFYLLIPGTRSHLSGTSSCKSPWSLMNATSLQIPAQRWARNAGGEVPEALGGLAPPVQGPGGRHKLLPGKRGVLLPGYLAPDVWSCGPACVTPVLVGGELPRTWSVPPRVVCPTPREELRVGCGDTCGHMHTCPCARACVTPTRWLIHAASVWPLFLTEVPRRRSFGLGDASFSFLLLLVQSFGGCIIRRPGESVLLPQRPFPTPPSGAELLRGGSGRCGEPGGGDSENGAVASDLAGCWRACAPRIGVCPPVLTAA